MIECLETFRFADPRWNYLLYPCTVGRSPVTRKVLAEAQFDEVWVEIYRSVRDAIAHHVVTRTPATFNLTRSYGHFLVFVLTSSRFNFFLYDHNFQVYVQQSCPDW